MTSDGPVLQHTTVEALDIIPGRATASEKDFRYTGGYIVSTEWFLQSDSLCYNWSFFVLHKITLKNVEDY